MGTPELVDALAIFIRESRRPSSGRHGQLDMEDIRETDPSWAGKLPVSLRTGLRCWRRHGKSPSNPEELEDYIVRYYLK